RAGRDGLPSKCRIYYSINDRNTIAFLIGKEVAKQKDKQKTKSDYDPETALKDFEKMVNYCENTLKCRHSIVLAEFVGDEGVVNRGSQASCDFCVEPKKLRARHAEFEKA